MEADEEEVVANVVDVGVIEKAQSTKQILVLEEVGLNYGIFSDLTIFDTIWSY